MEAVGNSRSSGLEAPSSEARAVDKHEDIAGRPSGAGLYLRNRQGLCLHALGAFGVLGKVGGADILGKSWPKRGRGLRMASPSFAVSELSTQAYNISERDPD